MEDQGNFNLEFGDVELLFLATSDDEDLALVAESVIEPSRDIQELLRRTNADVNADIPPPETPARPSATVGPTRFHRCDENELIDIFDGRQSTATKKNTQWAVKLLQDWCLEVAGEPVGLETVDPPTLGRLLAQFYCEARPAKPQPGNPSGHLYHRNTLINIRAGINRKLADLNRNIDVVRDKEFKYANGMLDGLLKKRASQGLAQYTQHHEPLEDEDQEKISTYLLGAHSSPVVLRQAVWYSLSLQFVSRGLEFHHQLRRDSFVFQSDGTGEYVTISCDTKQKNYQGDCVQAKHLRGNGCMQPVAKIVRSRC
ncbi:hypothetical protein ScPMuIL_016377 [Solemya velum]